MLDAMILMACICVCTTVGMWASGETTRRMESGSCITTPALCSKGTSSMISDMVGE